MTELLTKTPFEDIVQSDMFTFYVGEERKPFVAHSEAVAATSQVFDTLVNGGMSEAQTRSAELKDVDPETFTRFLEYAYRHDYASPSCPEATSPHENGAKSSAAFVSPSQTSGFGASDFNPAQHPTRPSFGFGSSGLDSGWGNSRSAPSDYGAVPSTKTPIKHSKARAHTRSSFSKRDYPCPIYDVSASPSTTVDDDPMSPSLGFAPAFLAHARLYTFADMRMVYPLKKLALHKLHKALVGFEPHVDRLGDVVELARYAYEHGEDRSEDGKIDAMREMVLEYIVCHMKSMSADTELRSLMDGEGELAGDFWNIISREVL
ncbi:hypothetical protein C7974DRAFT_231870 [Boeremia exigua]|uniref:uncharacterized protein n=1 Tax=Boeremia exigua TaxID=749465 RepID=UPI001E8D04C5|nr:uncharacterized protein C7974DRAFT_231870 [Boeremia exigua]KAH6620345.1 hypothetical protein C7974DRAFT_231870 [Boeremia exigua]